MAEHTNAKKIAITLLFFLIAGLCEIGGGYLVWLWLRDGMSWMAGALGGFVLFLYGVVPTFQPSHFHRIYAAYGGIFIVMALVWGWIFERVTPDRFDVIGAAIAMAGVAIIFYMPRKGKGEGEKAVWSN
jgi:small multidrug resistance family-3 protein